MRRSTVFAAFLVILPTWATTTYNSQAAWLAAWNGSVSCLSWPSASTLCEPFNRTTDGNNYVAYQDFFHYITANGDIKAPSGVDPSNPGPSNGTDSGTPNPLSVAPSSTWVWNDHITGAATTTFQYGSWDLSHTTFTPTAVFGLGAFFDMSPRSNPFNYNASGHVGPGLNAPGSGLVFNIYYQGSLVDSWVTPLVDDADNNNVYRGFYGFLSAQPFTDFTMTAGNYTYSYSCATGTCIMNNDGGELFDLDNLVFATAVPEPATFPLLAAGIGLLAWVRRSKYKIYLT